jgi:hypothetical protein
VTDFPISLIKHCITPHFTKESIQTLLNAPPFTQLLHTILTEHFKEGPFMTDAKTTLAKIVIKEQGFPVSWQESQDPLCDLLKDWIVDTLTEANEMTEVYPPNPQLVLLILNCCQSNYTPRNVEKFFRSKDVIAVIEHTIHKHFDSGHSFYRGNPISSPRELKEAAKGILFMKLNQRKGFSDEWMTFKTSRVIGNFYLWCKHRIHDYMKSKRSPQMTSMSSFSVDEESGKCAEDLAYEKSVGFNIEADIVDDMINASDEAVKNMLTKFILDIPMLAIEEASFMIGKGEDSWNLFMKLNDLNILQWLMSEPRYLDNIDIFDVLSDKAGISIKTIAKWKNNLPALMSDIASSSTSQGTKAKDYTLLAFSTTVLSIEELRALASIKKDRETLRRRNNNTDAGIYTLCLLACLTIKGSNPIGSNLLAAIMCFYQSLACKILPGNRWPLTELFLSTWANNTGSLSDLREELLTVISLIRYESDYADLSKTKQENVRKILRIVKYIGQQIASSPHIPLEAR